MPTKMRAPRRIQNGSLMTSLREMTMISADKMRSVVIADLTRLSSASAPFSWTDSVSFSRWGRTWCRIFSAPSKHKKVPPHIRMGVSAHGAIQERIMAMGKMMTSLLMSEPLVMRQIIGNSRWGLIPSTYCGVTAASSTTTPAAFTEVLPARAATSSTLEAAERAIRATSSSRAKRPPAINYPSGVRVMLSDHVKCIP